MLFEIYFFIQFLDQSAKLKFKLKLHAISSNHSLQ
jgi:hypothetical protein